MNSVENLENTSVYDQLFKVLIDVNKNKELQRKVDDELSEKYEILRGTFNEMIAHPEKIYEYEEDKLGAIILTLHENTKRIEIKPDLYYSKYQINKFKKYKSPIVEPTFSFPLTYSDVLFGSETDYVTKMSFQDIGKHMNDRIWNYNILTQRNPIKTKRKNGKVKITPKVNKRSVNEIKELILQGKFLPDSPIVVNVLYDGEDEILYNVSERELIVESASEIDIIDGYHRILAVLSVLEENPNLEGYLYVSIRNYDLETARYYLGQHNSFNTFDKTHVRQLKSLGIPDKIVEELNVKSELRGRITTSTTVKLRFNEITNFAVLSDAIKDVFNPTNGKDKLEHSYVLSRFFDYLFGTYEDEFVTNVKSVYEKSWINHHNTFVGYVVIANALYRKHGKDFPLDEIVRVIDSINFSKEGSDYNNILTTQGKVNSKAVKKKIRAFFEDVCNQLI